MAIERLPGATPEPAPTATTDRAGVEQVPAAARLQILSTEHWSLLATRSMNWNEAFSRAAMFLSTLSGAVVALALAAQMTSFGFGFVVFALVLLPVVLFIGVTTYLRLVDVNGEEVRLVLGMNRLRHAYLDLAPELEPYFITGRYDDEAGFLFTVGAPPGAQFAYRHGFVTTPGMIGFINALIAAVLTAVVVLQLGLGTPVALALGAVAFFAVAWALIVYQFRQMVGTAASIEPRFPTPREAPGPIAG